MGYTLLVKIPLKYVRKYLLAKQLSEDNLCTDLDKYIDIVESMSDRAFNQSYSKNRKKIESSKINKKYMVALIKEKMDKPDVAFDLGVYYEY